jgi:AcrR family transcriptional regulator
LNLWPVGWWPAKGTFYWHFRDRGELITETLERWERRDTVEVIAAPADRLRELARSAYAGAADFGGRRRTPSGPGPSSPSNCGS